MAKLIHCEIRDNGEIRDNEGKIVDGGLGTARLITLKRSTESDLDFASIDWYAGIGEGTCLKFSKLDTVNSSNGLVNFIKIHDNPSVGREITLNTNNFKIGENIVINEINKEMSFANDTISFNADNAFNISTGSATITSSGDISFTSTGNFSININNDIVKNIIKIDSGSEPIIHLSNVDIDSNCIRTNGGLYIYNGDNYYYPLKMIASYSNDFYANSGNLNGNLDVLKGTVSAKTITDTILKINEGKITNTKIIELSNNTTGANPSIKLTASTGTVEAVLFNATSDERLKENIQEYKPENSILDLPVKEFDYKDTKQHEIGCIAQDLQTLFPELVSERDDGYLSVKETKLVYLLLLEVKKLKKEIENLKK